MYIEQCETSVAAQSISAPTTPSAHPISGGAVSTPPNPDGATANPYPLPLRRDRLSPVRQGAFRPQATRYGNFNRILPASNSKGKGDSSMLGIVLS